MAIIRNTLGWAGLKFGELYQKVSAIVFRRGLKKYEPGPLNTQSPLTP